MIDFTSIANEFAAKGWTAHRVDDSTFTVPTSDFNNTGEYWQVRIRYDLMLAASPTNRDMLQCVEVRFCTGVESTYEEQEDNPEPMDIDSWLWLPYLDQGPVDARRLITAVSLAMLLRTEALKGGEPEWDQIDWGRRIGRVWRDGRVEDEPLSGLDACAAARRMYDHPYDPFRLEDEDTYILVEEDNVEYFGRLRDGHSIPGHIGPARGWSVSEEPYLDDTDRAALIAAYRSGHRAGYSHGFEQGADFGAEAGFAEWAEDTEPDTDPEN